MYVCALLFCKLFLVSIAIIFMSESQLQNEIFKTIFGFMYEGIRIEYLCSRATIFIYYLRRIVLLLVVFILKDNFTIQLLSVIATNFVSMMHSASRPHSDPIQNRQEILCQYIVAMQGLCLFSWTPWVP